MKESFVVLPSREAKPRQRGLTCLLDNGIPTRLFHDVIASHSELIDFVKFGWGTALVTRDLEKKLLALEQEKIDFFFGGTLFEKAYLQNKVSEYRAFCLGVNCRYVEISNGTIPLANREKGTYISRFAEDFTVFSEVGYKNPERSERLSPARWIQFILEDLEAGATKVATEARESGVGGICRSNGELRYGLIEEILESNIDVNKLIFEAPSKALQLYFIRKIGPNVNLANISFADPLNLETLRLGLRSDTLMAFEGDSTEITV